MVVSCLTGEVCVHGPVYLWSGRLATMLAMAALFFVSMGRAEESPGSWRPESAPGGVAATVASGGAIAPYRWDAPREATGPRSPFRSWDTYVWYGSWAALAWGDWRSTQGALKRGAYEMNPLLACEGPMAIWKLPGCREGNINRAAFLGANLTVPLVRLAYDTWGYKRASERQRVWGRRLKWVPQMVKAGIVISNTRQARK